MFRSRRRTVLTQLWKCRSHHRGPGSADETAPPAVNDDRDRCCWTRRRPRDSDTVEDPASGPQTRPDAGTMVRKSDAIAVLDRLGLPELELLLDIVQGAGQQVSGCIPAPADPPSDHPGGCFLPPHILCWLLYRWTPLDDAEGCWDVELSQLKKMPGCAGVTEASVCCNPYHWSRIAAQVTDTSKLSALAVLPCILVNKHFRWLYTRR